MIRRVDEIVRAAANLDARELLRLRKELDRLEEKLWNAELARTTAELKRRHITDKEIDRHVMRRRREGRS